MTDIFALAEQVGHALKARKLMLAAAESCTGGGIGEAVTMVPGSSAWFERGFVTYTNTAKREMLGVKTETLDTDGAVSEQTVKEMQSVSDRSLSRRVVYSFTPSSYRAMSSGTTWTFLSESSSCRVRRNMLRLRDDANDTASAIQTCVRDNSHESDTAAAVNEPDTSPAQQPPYFPGRLPINGHGSRTGTTKDGNTSEHGSIVRQYCVPSSPATRSRRRSPRQAYRKSMN